MDSSPLLLAAEPGSTSQPGSSRAIGPLTSSAWPPGLGPSGSHVMDSLAAGGRTAREKAGSQKTVGCAPRAARDLPELRRVAGDWWYPLHRV